MKMKKENFVHFVSPYSVRDSRDAGIWIIFLFSSLGFILVRIWLCEWILMWDRVKSECRRCRFYIKRNRSLKTFIDEHQKMPLKNFTFPFVHRFSFCLFCKLWFAYRDILVSLFRILCRIILSLQYLKYIIPLETAVASSDGDCCFVVSTSTDVGKLSTKTIEINKNAIVEFQELFSYIFAVD